MTGQIDWMAVAGSLIVFGFFYFIIKLGNLSVGAEVKEVATWAKENGFKHFAKNIALPVSFNQRYGQFLFSQWFFKKGEGEFGLKFYAAQQVIGEDFEAMELARVCWSRQRNSAPAVVRHSIWFLAIRVEGFGHDHQVIGPQEGAGYGEIVERMGNGATFEKKFEVGGIDEARMSFELKDFLLREAPKGFEWRGEWVVVSSRSSMPTWVLRDVTPFLQRVKNLAEA